MIWLWVWEISSCLGGDLDAIVAWAKAHQVGLFVKTHDGATTNPNGDLAIQLIQKCRAAKVAVRAWGYLYPDVDPGLQASLAAAASVDYVGDAEVEFDGKPAQAQQLVDALKREMPERHLSMAPLPIVSYHDSGQYAQFNRLDEEVPQAYAGTGNRDALGTLEWSKQEWAVFPGCNIAPAIYAADQPADELRKAIAFCFGPDRQWGNGDLSIWSLQHLTPGHIAVIDEFTKGADMTKDEVTALLVSYGLLDQYKFPAAVKETEALYHHVHEAPPNLTTQPILVPFDDAIFEGSSAPLPDGVIQAVAWMRKDGNGAWEFYDAAGNKLA